MKLLAIGTLAVLGTGYTATQLSQAEKPVELRIEAASEGTVTILVPDGDITIEGWRRDEIEVVGTLDDDNAAITLNSRRDHAELSLLGDVPVNAKLHIRIPQHNNLDIETTTANVLVVAVDGTLRFESIDGSLTVDGEPRGVVARSTTGNIAIPAANVPGFAHSEHGTVRLGPGTGLTALARYQDQRSHNIGAHIGDIVAAALETIDIDGLIDYNTMQHRLDFDLSGSLHLDLADLGDLFDDMGDLFDDLEDELSDELERLGDDLETLGEDLRHKHRRTHRR